MSYKQRIENYQKEKKKTDYSFLPHIARALLLALLYKTSMFLKETYDLTLFQALAVLLLAPLAAALALALVLIALTTVLAIVFLIGVTLYKEGLVGLGKITIESLVSLSKLAYQKIFKPILYGKRGGAERRPRT